MCSLRAPLAILLAVGGCRVFEPGLPQSYDGVASSPRLPDAAPDATRDTTQPDSPREVGRDEPGPVGPAVVQGCADGTREGFGSVADWPDIAGCAGAWSLGGLLSQEARIPACMREA